MSYTNDEIKLIIFQSHGKDHKALIQLQERIAELEGEVEGLGKLLAQSQPHQHIQRLETALSDARGVMEFYVNKSNWRSPSTGFALQYDPIDSPVEADKGQKARDFLTKYPE